jgi:XTP/dITP diphosphohydrolase
MCAAIPTTTLYVATSNPGKLRDFAAAAHQGATPSRQFVIAPMPCLDRIPPPPENEPTFEGNAREKAIYYSRLAPGSDVLADDSGLEVDALDGSPGVRSARYAAYHGFDDSQPALDVDAVNNALLLRHLTPVPEAARTARYRCVLALARDGECLLTSEGALEGRIALVPQGAGGFGYDPLFYLPELEKTMAEIDLDTRNEISHRGRALRTLFAELQSHPVFQQP